MNDKAKITRISKASILFYIAAVVFLLIGAFSIYMAYESIQNYQTQYTLEVKDILNVYFSGAAPFFAYGIISYGIGVVISKVSELNYHLTLCMDDAVLEKERIEDIDDLKDETPVEETK